MYIFLLDHIVVFHQVSDSNSQDISLEKKANGIALHYDIA